MARKKQITLPYKYGLGSYLDILQIKWGYTDPGTDQQIWLIVPCSFNETDIFNLALSYSDWAQKNND